MFEQIYRLLVSLFGESKQGYYDSGTVQYQFNCPYCSDEKGFVDGKYNLEINFTLGKFHCWACGNAGKLSKLFKHHGSKELLDEYFQCVKELKEAKLLDINLFKDESGILDEDTSVFLPKSFTKVNLESCNNKKVVEYLRSRRINQEIIDQYNIGYTSWEGEEWKYRNRIIVPSYNRFGELDYWSGRDYSGKAKFKYWNSDADSGAGKKTDIVFNEGMIRYDADIVLVEGIFDSIYYYNAVPLMGKVLNKDFSLYKKLVENANADIMVCLDADTEINETKKIYKLLNNSRLRGHIWYIMLDKHKDFGEIYETEGKIGIINAIKSRKKFHELDLLI